MNAVHLARRLRPFVWALSALALVAMAVWWWSTWTDAGPGGDGRERRGREPPFGDQVDSRFESGSSGLLAARSGHVVLPQHHW